MDIPITRNAEENKERTPKKDRYVKTQRSFCGAPDWIRTSGLPGRRTVTDGKTQRYSAGNCVVCTTSGAVCGGYKRMLGRKKRYTEPAGKKEWPDGGQEV